MVSRSPLIGYNHNIRYNNRIYHVQTEDSGVKSPHIFTHLFHSGMIISSARTDYLEFVEEPDHEQKVRDLMQEQHKRLMKQLRRGEFDDKIIALMGSLEPDEPEGDESPVDFAPLPTETTLPLVASPPPAQAEPPAEAAQPAVPVVEPLPASVMLRPAEAPELRPPPPPAVIAAQPESMAPIPALEPLPLDVKPAEPAKPAMTPSDTVEDIKSAPALGPVEKVPTFELEMPDDLDDLDNLDLDDEATVRFTIPTNFTSSLETASTKTQQEKKAQQEKAASRAPNPSMQRLDIKPQTVHRPSEEIPPLTFSPPSKEVQPQSVRRPDEVTKIAFPPQVKHPRLEAEVTEIYDMRPSQTQDMDAPPPIPDSYTNDRPTQPFGEKDDSSVIVDRPPAEDLLGEGSLLNSPTFYSELRRNKKDELPEKAATVTQRPSGVFGKPVPDTPQVPRSEERGPVQSRRAGVFPVAGAPAQKPPHPDPNVRRKAPSSHVPPVSAQAPPPRQPRPTERPPWSRPPAASQGSEFKAPQEKPAPSRSAPARPRSAESPVVTRPAVIISTPTHGKSPARARPQATRGVRPSAPFHGGRTPTPATPARVVKMQSPSIFGSDLITERSLDEVILSYLAEDIESSNK